MSRKSQLKSVIARAWGRSPRFILWKVQESALRQLRRVPYLYETRRISRLKVQKLFSHDDGVLTYLRTRTTCNFFPGIKDFKHVFQYLTSHDPDYFSQVISKAEKIITNKIFILALGDTYLGSKVDWLQDYSSGLRWEPGYAFNIDYVDLKRPSDVRVTWDLNRLYFLPDLGKAYRLNNDDRYVQKFMEYFNSWNLANPVAYSVNWTCPMDVAIRAINMIWAFEFCITSDRIDDDFALNFLQTLIIHGRFIYRNLEYNDYPGNHYIANLVGLAYLGLYFREYPEAKKWLETSVKGLETEIRRQVNEDGVDYEKSLPYHHLVTEMFLSAMILFNNNAIPLSPLLKNRLERMVEFVQAYLPPGGNCPLIGDNDDGRICKLGNQESGDHRYLLSTGAMLFHRPDLKISAGRFWEESAWLLGSKGINDFQGLNESASIPNTNLSVSFPKGGFYVMRSNNDHLIIDCGDFGRNGKGGHGHNDTLSFTLLVEGESLLVDTGNSKYTANREERVYSLGTRSHNALIVDEMEMAEIIQLGIIGISDTPVKPLEWSSDSTEDKFIGEHYGYFRLPGHITHRRSISFRKLEHRFLFVDNVYGEGKHKIELTWHFNPVFDVWIKGSNFYCKSSVTQCLYVIKAEESLELCLERHPIYPNYGVSVDAWMGITRGNFDLPISVHHEISKLYSWQNWS